jgi:hypothetical protein
VGSLISLPVPFPQYLAIFPEKPAAKTGENVDEFQLLVYPNWESLPHPLRKMGDWESPQEATFFPSYLRENKKRQ